MTSNISQFQNKIRIDPPPKQASQAATPQKTSIPFRPRAALPKVRSGCVTCKRRRVKCDEGKPDCRRCTSTGRTCEGYITPGSRGSNWETHSNASYQTSESGSSTLKSISVYSSLFDNAGDSHELHSFEYIQSRMGGMSGYFVSDFWVRLVPQVSHTEPTVRHALLALSSLYKLHEYREQGLAPSGGCPKRLLHQRALSQYAKAVSTLSKKLSEGSSDLGVTLMTCLLFIWLEFLRNDFETGFRHLKSGLKILQVAKSHGRMQSEIEVAVEPLFERLKGQVAFMGCPNIEFHSSALSEYSDSSESIPSSFSSIFEASSYLDRELSSIYITIRRQQEVSLFWSKDKYPQPPPFSITEARKTRLARLEEWQNTFQEFRQSSHSTQNSETSAHIVFTQVNHCCIVLILETLFPQSEMVYDNFTPHFTHLLSQIKALLSICNPANRSPALSFEQGIIGPLLFIIVKCRVLPLRKRALELLRQAPEREGMWHRDSIYRGAALKVYVEERARVGEGLEGLPDCVRTTRETVTDLGDDRVRITFRRSGNNTDGFTEEIEAVNSNFGAML